MLLDFVLAIPTPAPTVEPAEALSVYDWWRDIGLPGLVGVAGLALTAVAVLVARRSNMLAKAATTAAEQSNSIAQRAAEQEEARVQQARDQVQREERRDFGNRFLAVIDRLVEELRADPTLWDKPIDAVGDNALYALGPMVFEATARGWTDELPSDSAVQLVRSAAKAGGGARREQAARNAAHTVIRFWIEDPSSATRMAAFITEDTLKRIA